MVFQYLMITPVFFTKHKYETPILRFSKPKEIFHVWKCENWRFPRSIVQLAAGWWLVHWRAEQSRTSVVTVNFPSLQKGGPSSSQKAYLHQASWHKTWNRVHTERFHIKEGKEPKTWTRMVGMKIFCIKEDGRPGRLGDKVATHPVGTRARWKRHQGDLSMLEWYEHAPKITPNIRACSPELETNVLDWCLYENFENTLEYQSYCAASRNSLEKTAVDSKQLDSWSCSYCTRIVWLILVDADTGCIWWDAPYSCSCSCSYCTRLHVTRSPLQRRQRAAERCIRNAEAVGTKKDSAWRVQC